MKQIPRKVLKHKGKFKDRVKKRKQWMNVFIKKYGKPVIVHATYYPEVFNKILNDKMIKLPKEHKSPRMSPYLQKFLGIDNTIYYGLNFDYNIGYGFKYAFIFDLDYLKDLKYYSDLLGFRIYLSIINYWYLNDRKYFEKLRKYNKNTKKATDTYLRVGGNGKRRKFFAFWLAEKEVFNFIMKYPKKKELIKIIKAREIEMRTKYPYSIETAKEDLENNSYTEIVGLKNNNLATNPYFMGFYIEGKISKKLLAKLKKDFPGKIVFDGKRIKEISKL